MPRPDGRKPDELRPVRLKTSWSKYAEGSCLIEMGDTHVLCTASVEESVPPFLKGTSSGWVTGEYGMLPRSCESRRSRDGGRGQGDGRSVEIQRLIGRSLRSITDLRALGERTIILDCDVVQADGGTRTASITGAYVALTEAVLWLMQQGILKVNPLLGNVAAVSVGIVEREERLDLTYAEDSAAALDMNVVMNQAGRIVEVQATAEGPPVERARLNSLLDLAEKGIRELIQKQNEVIEKLKLG